MNNGATRCAGFLHLSKRRCLLLSKTRHKFRNVRIRFAGSRLSANLQDADPFKMTEEELKSLHDNIRKELRTDLDNLRESCQYYFDGQGKLFRPMTIMLVGKASNVHLKKPSFLSDSQKSMAMIAEMIHTASLLHDDVIDNADTRRNKPSINKVFTQKQSILAGDYILSRASVLLAQVGNTEAVKNFSHIIEDLVRGELMQLVPKDDISQRFNHYLQKTFRKTASLVAYSCKSVALLSGGDEHLQQIAFDYGKNVGIAFQLVDDALDFISSSEALGKPTGADLTLGLATAPVLFAAQKYPDLHALISRRFKNKADVKEAMNLVKKSDGIEETFMLARKYAKEAVTNLSEIENTREKQALINITNLVIDRSR